mgnify:CR=1 FL=1
MTLTTKQTIGILFILLISSALYFPNSFGATVDDLYVYAICLAALLPAGLFQISRITKKLDFFVILIISLGIGSLWYFIIQKIYPSSALVFFASVSCGSYLVLRIK